jgi:hypothetical protein
VLATAEIIDAYCVSEEKPVPRSDILTIGTLAPVIACRNCKEH